MDNEQSANGGDAGVGLGPEETPGPTDLLSRLDAHPWFRRGVVIGAAVVCGLLIAPQLLSQAYPSDPGLIGTPSTGNFKSPYDLEVIDSDTTSQQREAAMAEVRRVYDFDAKLADKRTTELEQAFTAMRVRLEALLQSRPDLAGGPRSKAHDQRVLEALDGAVPELEKALGTQLKPDEASALLAARFDQELGDMLGRVVGDALREQIVAERAVLEADRARGITVQRVPDDGTQPRTITDVDSVRDVETVRRDLGPRVMHLYPTAPAGWRELVIGLGSRLIEPSLTPNRAATEVAREYARVGVKPFAITVKKGEMVIRDGERLTRRHLLVFDAMQRQSGGSSIILVALGGTLAVLLFVLVALGWAPGASRIRALNSRDTVFLAALFLSGLAAARVWSAVAYALHDRFTVWPLDALIFVLPLAAGAMIARLVLRAGVAVWFAILSALVLNLVVQGDRPLVLFALVGSIVGMTRIRTISSRGDLLRAGVAVGVAQAAAAVVIELLSGQAGLTSYLFSAGAAFAGGALSGLVTLGLTPVVEAVFGYTTDLKLLELANLNHPALKELIVQAPGSYHHSVIVGALVEAAAEAIGANPLLARVMAYYHDLGKGCNPQYFIENQRSGQNPHDKLKPSMSAMIIRRHVNDGLEIARRYRLGEPIRAAIAEHHGTTLIHFFHHKAKELAEEADSVAEIDYRYTGTKPQSREAALVMLGDSVEAAARSVPDPTPARLAGVVARIINLKFADEQLEECDITLKDLHQIAKSFSTVLASIYHTRPEYPELLRDLSSGKKPNGDSDPKPAKGSKDLDGPPEEPRPDNLRRLGLS
jgi:putative nucleotidyltransferase with HDIG domain